MPLPRGPTRRTAFEDRSVTAVPRMVPPSRKVTVPAGDPSGELTVATKVELLFGGFISGADEPSVARAVAAAASTEILTGAEILPAKGPFALKAAVME